MAVNKMEYKQVRRYLFLMILACAIYLFYSIIVVYYNTQALKNGSSVKCVDAYHAVHIVLI